MRSLAVACISLTLGASLTGCAPTKQALLASGGPADFVEMQRVTDEWGDDPPSASVPIMVGEREQTFSVWLHRSKPKIMVQTTELAGTAAAGFVRGLSAGIVASNPEASPYAQAAMTHLDATRGPGCRLTMARPITRIGFEWDYDCTPPTPPRPARPKPR